MRPTYQLHSIYILAVFALFALAPIHASAETPFNERNLLLSQDTELQVQWATRFEHGEGVSRDLDVANRLYCAAARKGNVAAQSQLAWLFAHGRGVEKNEPMAAAWYTLAANQGDAPSPRRCRRRSRRCRR